MNSQQSLALERILGITSLSNSTLAVTKSNGTIYVAGCVAVLHSVDENKQIQFYRAQHAISCLALSRDDKYLVVGERGHNPKLIIFEVSTGKELMVLDQHKHGVGCVTFSPNGKYIVSAGFKVDRQLCIWDWTVGKCISIQKIGNKVNSISFHHSGDYFVTCGDKHLKWWYMQYVNSNYKTGVDEAPFNPKTALIDATLLENIANEKVFVSISGKPASIVESHAQSNFVDLLLFPSGAMSDSMICLTSTGKLCLFSCETRMITKWIQVANTSAYCLSHKAVSQSVSSLNTDFVFVGCSNGNICCFQTQSLTYVASLPLPAPLSIGEENPSNSLLEDGVDIKISHPSCTCLRVMSTDDKMNKSLVAFGKKFSNSKQGTMLVAVYADHSMFIWDINALYNNNTAIDCTTESIRYVRVQSFVYHRSCIWDLQFIDSIFGGTSGGSGGTQETPLMLPIGTMITCSADGSVKFWNMTNSTSSGKKNAKSMWKSPYSKDMLYSIEISGDKGDGAGLGPSITSSNKNSSSRKPYVATASLDIASPARGSVVRSSGDKAKEGNMDLSNVVLNMELPDRYQEESAARSFTIHPNHDYIACGDKFGVLRVYNIVTMLLVQTIPAHVAEVLSMCYSPWMYDNGDEGGSGAGNWNVTQNMGFRLDSDDFSEGSGSSGRSAPLLLLATAGRDRLIHVLNASIPGHYTPLVTLDNHSASVTAVKFTLDGKRLLSCGGDKTIVFNEVNGPNISRVKSVNTSHGTIMGLAIDATNKYAATTGQDKKLNVWNIKTGKFMRAYKHMDILGELYKCDIDPSGMYVAACTFDKKICIFDFFSGDLMAYFDSGHSELITAIRFSPNGKHLLTVAGDGCVLIWKVTDVLIKNMQDRIIELYTNLKQKQQQQHRNMLLQLQSVDSLPQPPGTVADSGPVGLPPAPPAPFPVINSSESPARGIHKPPIAIAPGVKSRGAVSRNGNALPPPPPLVDSVSSSITNSIASSIGESRASNMWAQRMSQNDNGLPEPPGEMLLFGQVRGTADPNHKLTLELTSGIGEDSVDISGMQPLPPPELVRDSITPPLHGKDRASQESPGMAVSSPNHMSASVDNLSRSTSGRLAISIEDKFDDVMLGDQSEEEVDEDDDYDDKQFTKNIHTVTPSKLHQELKKEELEAELMKKQLQSIKSKKGKDVDEADESRAVSQLSKLDRSASALENWLEEKLKVDDVSAVVEPVDEKCVEESLANLKLSLSSDYFRKNFEKIVSPIDSSRKNNVAPSSPPVSARVPEPGATSSPVKALLGGIHKKVHDNTASENGGALKRRRSSKGVENFSVADSRGNASVFRSRSEGGRSEACDSVNTSQARLENRKRETAAAVSLMRDRLSNMGIIVGGGDAEESVDIASEPVPSEVETNTSISTSIGEGKSDEEVEENQSILIAMDERDEFLGKSAHNNSILTDDSAENHHVFDFDSFEDEEASLVGSIAGNEAPVGGIAALPRGGDVNGAAVASSIQLLPPELESKQRSKPTAVSRPVVSRPMVTSSIESVATTISTDEALPVIQDADVVAIRGTTPSDAEQRDPVEDKTLQCKSALADLMAATRKALISYEELKYTRSAQATGSEREAELNRSATSQFRGISEIHSSVDRSLLSVLGGLPGLGKSTTRQSSDTITLDGGERDHGSELDIEGDASLQFTSLMEHMRNSSVMSVSGPSSPFSRHKVDKAEEADMVLFQFESSFVSLAQSAMSLVGGNLGATNQVTHANAGAKPYSVHSASQIKESQNNRDSRNQISSLSESVPAPGEESSMSFSCYLEAHSQSVSSTSGNLLNKNSEGTVSNTLADRSYHEDDTEEEGDVDSMMPSAVNNISEALNTYNSAPAAAPAIQPTSDTAGSTSSGADAALMSMFLDKYSDKLVDLLSDKIKAKLQQDGNSTLSSSASSIGTL